MNKSFFGQDFFDQLGCADDIIVSYNEDIIYFTDWINELGHRSVWSITDNLDIYISNL